MLQRLSAVRRISGARQCPTQAVVRDTPAIRRSVSRWSCTIAAPDQWQPRLAVAPRGVRVGASLLASDVVAEQTAFDCVQELRC